MIDIVSWSRRKKLSRKMWVGKSGQECGQEKVGGKKSERGGIFNMGGEKLAGTGKFVWQDIFLALNGNV